MTRPGAGVLTILCDPEDEAEISALWERERIFTPAMPRALAAERMAQWRRAVERSLGWAADE